MVHKQIGHSALITLFDLMDKKDLFVLICIPENFQEEYRDLVWHMRWLMENDVEINVINVYNLKKNREVIIQYMEMVIEYWKEKLKIKS